MIDLRNETARTYSEEIAEKIYGELANALPRLKSLLAEITRQAEG